MTKYQKMAGRIIIVQEERFRLLNNTGQGFLFSLSHAARITQQDLQRWHAADTPVTVHYQGEPNLASGIAHEIEPL